MSLSRQAPRFTVYINGSREDSAQVSTVLHVTGGSRKNTAVFEINESSETGKQFNGTLFKDVELPQIFENSFCQIVMEREDGYTEDVHWGMTVAANATLDSRGEKLTLTSRLDDYLYGQETTYPVSYYNPHHTDIFHVGGDHFGDLVFNPSFRDARMPAAYRDIRMPNKHDVSAAERRIIDPDSYSRDRKVYEAIPAIGFWELSEAVDFVCTNYNTSGLIDSPTLSELQAEIDDKEDVSNIVIRKFTPFPKMLDALLNPFGYFWYMNFNSSTPAARKIEIRKRRPEAKRGYVLQDYGSQLDTSDTQVKAFNVQLDVVSNAASAVEVFTERPIIENTWELWPAWDKKYDTLTPAELDISDDTFEHATEKKRVWRDWVLNENGEYRDVLVDRAIASVPTFAQDLTIDFTATGYTNAINYQRRRRFLPMLTADTWGRPGGKGTGGVYFEWSENAGVSWAPINFLVPNGAPITLSRDECGIRIGGTTKALEPLIAMREKHGEDWPETFRVRVTACIQGDQPEIRRQESSFAADETLLKRPKVLQVDGDRFKIRQITPGSRFLTGFAIPRPTLEANDSIPANGYAVRMHELYNAAQCSGTITLEGVDIAGGFLGTSCLGILRRGIAFATTAEALDESGFPTIIGVKYDIPRQETTLTLDSHRTQG